MAKEISLSSKKIKHLIWVIKCCLRSFRFCCIRMLCLVFIIFLNTHIFLFTTNFFLIFETKKNASHVRYQFGRKKKYFFKKIIRMIVSLNDFFIGVLLCYLWVKWLLYMLDIWCVPQVSFVLWALNEVIIQSKNSNV